MPMLRKSGGGSREGTPSPSGNGSASPSMQMRPVVTLVPSSPSSGQQRSSGALRSETLLPATTASSLIPSTSALAAAVAAAAASRRSPSQDDGASTATGPAAPARLTPPVSSAPNPLMPNVHKAAAAAAKANAAAPDASAPSLPAVTPSKSKPKAAVVEVSSSSAAPIDTPTKTKTAPRRASEQKDKAASESSFAPLPKEHADAVMTTTAPTAAAAAAPAAPTARPPAPLQAEVPAAALVAAALPAAALVQERVHAALPKPSVAATRKPDAPVTLAPAPPPPPMSRPPRGGAAQWLPVFSAALVECGIRLEAGLPVELTVDVSDFKSKLAKRLRRADSAPNVLGEFVDGMTDFLADLGCLQAACMPLPSRNGLSLKVANDSLVRLMLGVEPIQTHLLINLLEKLPVVQDDYSMSSEEINLPRLIVAQMRWLDFVVDGRQLADKLVEVLSVTNAEVQRELISSLPDILNDAEHRRMVDCLSMLVTSEPKLMVTILDALSNLTLPPHQVDEIRDKILKMLASVDVSDMPVVVRFIQQFINADNSVEVIFKLRGELDFQSLASTTAMATTTTTSGSRGQAGRSDHSRSAGFAATTSSTAVNGEMLTLEAIRAGLRFQQTVADAWIKVLQTVVAPQDHRVIDIFVLLMLLGLAPSRKLAETTLRKKIKAQQLSSTLLATVFRSHSQALSTYFKELMTVAEMLLRSAEHVAQTFAADIYRNVFLHFDGFCRQEVVGTLVTLIGAGESSRADTALQVLCDLSRTDGLRLAEFSIFIKNILDYLDTLPLSHIRMLFSLLTTLQMARREQLRQQQNQTGAAETLRQQPSSTDRTIASLMGIGAASASSSSSFDDALVEDDIYNTIRKQLHSSSGKFKRVGIVGALCVIEQALNLDVPNSEVAPPLDMLLDVRVTLDGNPDEGLDAAKRQNKNKRSAAASSSKPRDRVISDSHLSQAHELLDIVLKACDLASDCFGFFFDELSRVVRSTRLDPRLLATLINTLHLDSYIFDLENRESECQALTQALHRLGKSEFTPGLMGPISAALSSQQQVLRQQAVLDALAVEVSFNLDGDRTVGLLGLLGCVLDSKKSRHDLAMLLAPNFKLLQLCTRSTQNGVLDDMDGTLGFPVLFPRPAQMAASFGAFAPAVRRALCLGMVHVVNWFTELLNAFALRPGADTQIKLLYRVTALFELLGQLGRLLPLTPDFAAPPATFEQADAAVIKHPEAAPKRGTKTKGADPAKGTKGKTPQPNDDSDIEPAMMEPTKKVKSNAQSSSRPPPASDDENGENGEVEEEHAGDSDDDDAVSVAESDLKGAGSVASTAMRRAASGNFDSFARQLLDLAPFRACFREMDLEVFSLLATGRRFTRHLLSGDEPAQNVLLEQNMAGSSTAPGLQPPPALEFSMVHMRYMLDEMARQLKFGLSPPVSSAMPFLQARASKHQLHPRASSALEMRRFEALLLAKFVALLPHLCLHLEDVVGLCSRYYKVPSRKAVAKAAARAKADAQMEAEHGFVASSQSAHPRADDEDSDGDDDGHGEMPATGSGSVSSQFDEPMSKELAVHAAACVDLVLQCFRTFLASGAIAGQNAGQNAGSGASGAGPLPAALRSFVGVLAGRRAQMVRAIRTGHDQRASGAATWRQSRDQAPSTSDAMDEQHGLRTPLPELAAEAFGYLSSIMEAVTTLPTAATLLSCLELFILRTRQAHLSPALCELAEHVLRRERWFHSHCDTQSPAFVSACHSSSAITTAMFASLTTLPSSPTTTPAPLAVDAVSTAVDILLKHADNPLPMIETTIGEALALVAERHGDAVPGIKHAEISVPFLPTLSKRSLPAFFRASLDGVTGALRELDSVRELGVLVSGEGNANVQMVKLQSCVFNFWRLCSFVAKYSHRLVLLAVVKGGRQFVDTFLKVGMPFIDVHFIEMREPMTEMFKKLQQATRSLQMVCGHTKVVRDVSVLAQVPPLRKSLETLIFRVKVMFEVNGVRVAFSIGNLKHKSIRGEEVSSQGYGGDSDEEDDTLASVMEGEEEDESQHDSPTPQPLIAKLLGSTALTGRLTHKPPKTKDTDRAGAKARTKRRAEDALEAEGKKRPQLEESAPGSKRKAKADKHQEHDQERDHNDEAGSDRPDEAENEDEDEDEDEKARRKKARRARKSEKRRRARETSSEPEEEEEAAVEEEEEEQEEAPHNLLSAEASSEAENDAEGANNDDEDGEHDDHESGRSSKKARHRKHRHKASKRHRLAQVDSEAEDE
ncbi:hypothetical protein CAOG_002337 [Capsaspora owczarzaki ATCC 30864]|uniref:Fanconi anemia group D2 protein n=1 Tax=Capsaspora owczarzaki (strain ATCC 30864) TaxID=595528 RepID=A0A0D2WL35_CAPO3|nr:hypothetical protein CAOG_002337 [Capsaspora owczarzaki ATCC 30864]